MNMDSKSVGPAHGGGRIHSRMLYELVDSSPTGTIAIDSDGKVILCTHAAAYLLQLQEEKVLGKSLFNVLREEHDTLAKMLQQSMAGEPLHQVLLPMQNKEGVPIQALFSTSGCRGVDGIDHGMVLNLTEVTGQPLFQGDCSDREGVSDTLVDQTSYLIFTTDLAGRFTSINPAMREATGYTLDEGLQMTLAQMVGPESSEALLSESAQPPIGNGRTTFSLEMKNKAWRRIPVEVNAWTICRNGKAVGFQGIARDMTKYKRVENALRDINEKFQAIVHSSPMAIIALDLAGNVTMWNREAEEIYGWTEEEVLGKPLPYIPVEQQQEFLSMWNQAAQGVEFHQVECRRQRKDGSPIDTSVSVRPLREADGRIVGVMSVIADVTEQKREEEEILFQKTRFQSLFENSPVGIVILDAQDRIIGINHAFELIFGYSIDEIQGRVINDVIVPPELLPEAEQLSKNTQTGMTVDKESIRIRKDGGRVHVHVFGVPFTSQGKQLGIFGMYADVSKSRSLEDQLRQAQKMEAVGRLAGGIAHDFNNLLTSILGYGQLTLGQLDEKDPLRNHVQEIIKAGERATLLTNQLLAFSRKQVLQPVILNLNSIVADMDKMLRRLIGEDIELITHLDPHIGTVRADPGQMKQVLLNLAVNSRDAMPQGGKLIIETTSVDLDEAYVKQHAGMTAGPHIMLAVTDTGCGMDHETLSHMFEPFFTTKKEGKGTGLGLSTVYGIVKQSNGCIWAYSEPGKGSCLKIYLPRVETEATEITLSQESAPKGTGTILVVEDEDGVRNMIHSTLQMNGYKLLEAASGMEGLELSRKHKGKIDLLLTDVVMPQMNGTQLAEQLSASRPEMRIIFMSGYTEDGVIQLEEMEANMNFLQKPFSLNRLLSKVQEVLHGVSG
jgi:two-component system cell cycle sensor histidine kinase/response regulator CckA